MYQRFGEALQKKSTDHPVAPSSDPSKKDFNMSDASANAQHQVNPSGGQAVPATSDPSAPAIQTPQLTASNHNAAQTPVVSQQQQQPQSQTHLQPASIMPQIPQQVTNSTQPVSSNHIPNPSGHAPTPQPVAANAVAPATPAVTPSTSVPAPIQPGTTPVAPNATPTAAANTPVQVSAPVVSPSPAISSDVAGQPPVSQTHTGAPLANPANANSVTNVSIPSGNPTPQQPQSQATVAPTQSAPPQ